MNFRKSHIYSFFILGMLLFPCLNKDSVKSIDEEKLHIEKAVNSSIGFVKNKGMQPGGSACSMISMNGKVNRQTGKIPAGPESWKNEIANG
jgi:hypothetical protein